MRVAGRAGRAGYGRWSGPLRRLGRRVRGVAAGTGVLALALPLAWPSGVSGQHLNLPSVASVRSEVVRLADFVAGDSSPASSAPVQQTWPVSGTHEVPASQTQGLWHATGRAPGQGKGQLPQWSAHAPQGSASGTFTSGSSATGYDPATSTLVQSGTTAQSDFYKYADGTYTRDVWSSPVNYQTSGGTWAPINDTLVRGSAGRWQEKANSVAVSFATSGSDAALASVATPGGAQQVGFSLAGAGAVTASASASGTAVTYPGILPDTDVTETATANGLDEALTLDSAAAGDKWTFPLTLKGLTPSLDGGSVNLSDASGTVVAVIPPAVARSGPVSAADPASQASSQLTYSLVTDEGAPALEMSLSPSWLDAPGRVFPVVVDPSVTVDPQGSDYAQSLNGTAQAANNSGSALLPSGTTTTSGSTYDDIAFLDYSALGTSQKNYHVSAASLWMFDAYASQCTTAESVTAYQVTTSWSPSTSMTYPGPAYSTQDAQWTGTAPAAACSNTSGLTGKGGPVSLTFNPAGITLLNQWASGSSTEPNDGFAIVTSLTNAQAYKEFDSYNDSNVASSQGGNCTGNCQPYLSLTYSSTAADIAPQINSQFPPTNTTVPTLTPELLASGSDLDSWPDPTLEYDFKVYNSAGAKVADSNEIASNDWTVPASADLAWGQTYSWTVQAYDGDDDSPDPQSDYFTTTVPQPLVTSQLSLNPTGPGFNPQTGNWTTSATDAQVPTVGPALEITRDYNSSDPRTSGAFGAGWSSVLDMKVTAGEYNSAGATETEVVTYPDGEDVAFGLNPDGTTVTYSPPSGRYATLSPATSGSGFTLTDKNDTVYTFSQALTSGVYGISSITDADGRTETFGYTGSEITSITSASQRALAITWTNPSGAVYPHVASVVTGDAVANTPSTAQDWTYNYSGDDLASACPPASTTQCTEYAYTSGSDYPEAVLDSGPHSYWRLDETTGTTAADSVLANEGDANATYDVVNLGKDPGPLAGSSATAATFNGSDSIALQPNLVTSAAYQTISLWFKTTATDGVLFGSSAQDGAPTGTTTASFSPELYIGSDGKLEGAFLDGTTPTVMSSTAAVDDGHWHNAVLADSGSGQQLYLDGQPMGSLSAGFTSHTQTYDYVGAGYLGGGWPDEPSYAPGSSTGQAYGFHGDISDVAVWARQLTPSEAESLYADATHPAALLTKLTQPSGSVYAQITYDPLTGRVTNDTDSNGGTWQVSMPSTLGSSQAFVSSVLGAKPADYYRLNDAGATQVTDIAQNCGCYPPATYNNVAEGVSYGPFDDQNVTGYNGSSSYLSLPTSDTDDGGADSVGVWFKTTGTNEVLYSQQDASVKGSPSSKYNPVLYIGEDGKLNAEIWDGNTATAVSNYALNDGNWHYAVLTVGATSQSLYIDGGLQDTISGTVVPNEQWTNPAAGTGFAGGPWPDLSSSTVAARWFTGDLAELAWYPYQLSAAQVAGQYTNWQYANGFTPVQDETVTDPGGKTLKYTYDLLNGGRELSYTDGDGGITSYTYNTAGFPASTTDPDGDVTTTGYDIRGNLVSKTTCQDQSTDQCSTAYWTYLPDDSSATLNPAGTNDEVATYEDARSYSYADTEYQTTYAYDPAGDLTSETTPDTSAYPSGRTTTCTYTNGSGTGGYDGQKPPAGLQYQETTPGGAVTTTLYYTDGDVAQVTDPDGQSTVYTYDGLGRKLKQTVYSDSYPGGLVTNYTYNANGDLATETDPPVTDRVTGASHQEQTTYGYDPDGDVTSQVTADLGGGDPSRTVTSAYNQYDQLASQTDAAGDKTTYTYDAYGNKASETDPDGNVTDYTYDAEGHLLTTTLENYTGSPPGSQPAAPLLEESRAYDPAGRLATVTDSMGRMTAYSYTDNGLVSGVQDATSDWSQYSMAEWYSYDGAGNVTEEWTNDSDTATTYTVDADDLVTQEVTDPSGLDRTSTISYTPDEQQSSVTDSGPDGVSQTTSYTYDPDGNELSQSVTDPGAGGPDAWLRLTQSSGTAVADQASGGQPATAAGVTWNGTAGTFAGTTGSQVATAGPVVDTTGSFTVAGWVNLSAAGVGSTQALASQAAGTASGFTLGYDASTGDWQFARPLTDTASPPLASAESSAAATTGTWTFLAGSYNANTGAMTLYVNGAVAGTATDATPIEAHGAFTVGRAKTAGVQGDWLDGQAHDVQAYPRALTAAQVSQLNATGGGDVSVGALTTTWTRDERGLPTSMTDPDGTVTNYSYDQDGQLTITTGPPVTTQVYGSQPVTARPVTTTGYDTFGDKAETEDPNGNVTTYSYDADGRQVSQTLPPYTPPGGSSPITAVDTTAYDGDGNVTSTTDGLSNTTTYGYDQRGNQVTATDPARNVTTTAYDPDGEPLSVTDPTGAETESTYDYKGRLATSTQIERYTGSGTQPYTTNYSYNDATSGGWLSEETSPDGVTTQYAYNPAGEKTSVTNGAGNATSYSYNSLGEQTKVTNPDGTATATGYDGAGNVTSTTSLDASGNALATTSSTYDGEGDQLSATDAAGDSTTFTYDPTGMVTQEVQPVSSASGITTAYGYDAAGNQTLYTDGNGSQWWDTYNSWGLQGSRVEPSTAAYTTPVNSTFTLAYDADQNPVTETEPGGVTVSSTYNNLGELTGQSGTGADAATPTRSFGYNAAGDMTSASTSNTAGSGSNATSESLTYDDRGQVLTAAGSAGSTSYAYNGDGLVTSVADAAGTTSYGYDNDDRLSTLANPLTGTTATYSYNPDSLVSGISYGSGGDSQSFAYDGQHRLITDTLKSSSGSTVASISYGYDADSEITTETTTGLAGAASSTYTYDQAGRLTSWDNGTTTTQYGYDANGNLTQDGSKTYTYDARDELTSNGTGSFAYTARGTPSSEPGPGGSLAVTFDAYGDQASAGSRTYSYDALGRLVTDVPSSGGGYAFSYVGSTGTIASDGADDYTWDPSGSVLAASGTGGGGTGGVQALTDSHGNQVGQFTAAGTSLTASQAFDPWGNVTAATGTMTGLLGYQSAWTDTASGKDLMGARWYDPGAGDFTSADTMQVSADPDPAAGDPFAYAADEPLDLVDPTGHNIVPPGGAENAGTTARIGNGDTSANNFIADETTARIVQQAVISAPNDAAKAAAARAAAAKVAQQQATAHQEAVAAAARAAAQARAREQAAARVKASLARAAAAQAAAKQARAQRPAGTRTIYDSPMGCSSGVQFRIGGCAGESTAAGSTAAQVKQAIEGAVIILLSTITDGLGDALIGAADAGDAGDAAAAGQSAKADQAAGATGNEDPNADEDAPSCQTATPGGQSFTAATPVLLASGKAVPISSLKPGDKVLAADTKTGKDQPETVTAVLLHHDTDLYDLTIRTGGRTEVIHTTSSHLFWDPSPDHGWIPANQLKPGMHLKTPDGQPAVVAGGSVPAVRDGWMWDLTVPGNNDHDFYVEVAAASVLVHNDSCPTNLGRGSTGRTEPASLKEQLAMQEAQSNSTAGRVITRITMNDPRWPGEEGWVKMQQNVNGVVIHYTYNPLINAVDDFKFVP
jgi:RHS repeat-associated protein